MGEFAGLKRDSAKSGGKSNDRVVQGKVNVGRIIQMARMNPGMLTPRDVAQLQKTIGNRAVTQLLGSQTVQRVELPEEEEEEVLQGKFEAVQRKELPEEEEPLQMRRGNNTGMPDQLKAGVESLSGIDMSGVRVHYNSDKPAGLGALAYTQGTDIHVAPGQERHLPHEAWHVVQQKQGRVQPTVQLKGIGVNDDAGLEREADVMGEKVRNSPVQSAQRLREEETGSPGTSEAPVQRYVVKGNARVSETGMAVTGNGESKICYADPGLIKSSNEILTARNSGVRFTGDNSNSHDIDAPDGSGKKSLVKVVPEILCSDSGLVGDNQNFLADCGRSSRQVMGNRGTNAPHDGESPRGVYTHGNKEMETPTKSSNPNTFRDEILTAELGVNARAKYLNMTSLEKDKFDKEHRINKYAAPEVGEAFVSVRDDTQTMRGFNFHWGGVVMVTGEDRVTFENYAKPGTNYDTKDSLWHFMMFGPARKPGQTFHEQNEGGLGVGEKDKNNATFAAVNANYTEMAKGLSLETMSGFCQRGTRDAIVDALIVEVENRDFSGTPIPDILNFLDKVQGFNVTDIYKNRIKSALATALEQKDYSLQHTVDILNFINRVEAYTLQGGSKAQIKAKMEAPFANKKITLYVRYKGGGKSITGYMAAANGGKRVTTPSKKFKTAGTHITHDIPVKDLYTGAKMTSISVYFYKSNLIMSDTKKLTLIWSMANRDEKLDDSNQYYTISVSHTV